MSKEKQDDCYKVFADDCDGVFAQILLDIISENDLDLDEVKATLQAWTEKGRNENEDHTIKT